MGGAGALRAEALRESLPDFYARAVVDTELDPIAQPEIDITGGEDERRGQLRRRGPGAAARLHPRLRRAAGDLARPRREGGGGASARSTGCARTTPSSTSSSRPAIDGDLVTIDLHGNDASGAEVVGVDDYLYEVGSGTVVPELDAELHGAKAGAIVAFDSANPQSPEEQIVVPGARQRGQGQEAARARPTSGRPRAPSSPPWPSCAPTSTSGSRRVKLVQTQMALRQKTLEALARSRRRRRRARGPGRRRGQRAPARPAAPARGPEAGPGRVLPGHRHLARRPAGRRAGGRRRRRSRPTWRCAPWPTPRSFTLSDEELDAEIATMAERMDTTADRAPPATRHGRPDRRGTLGAAQGQGAGVAAGPRGALRRRGQPDVTGRPRSGRCRRTSEVEQNEETM